MDPQGRTVSVLLIRSAKSKATTCWAPAYFSTQAIAVSEAAMFQTLLRTEADSAKFPRDEIVAPPISNMSTSAPVTEKNRFPHPKCVTGFSTRLSFHKGSRQPSSFRYNREYRVSRCAPLSVQNRRQSPLQEYSCQICLSRLQQTHHRRP